MSFFVLLSTRECIKRKLEIFGIGVGIRHDCKQRVSKIKKSLGMFNVSVGNGDVT